MDADAEKARKKELHRKSMIVTGAVTAGCGLMAAWIFWAPTALLPAFRLGGKQPAPAAAPRPMAVKWSDFSLARARKLDRLVLLSVTAPWCAPCARMDGDAYADAETAALLDRSFVAVRVDADERPDLELRYLGAGWPTTALLLPTGEILDSGTYMSGKVLRGWLEAIAQKYRDRRAGVLEAAQQAAAKRAKNEQTPIGDPAAALETARVLLEKTWDNPRLPRWDRLAALARLHAPWARPLALHGLDAARGFIGPEGTVRRAKASDGSLEDETRLRDQADAVEALKLLKPEAVAGLHLDKPRYCDEAGRLGKPEACFAARKDGLAPRRPGSSVFGLLGDQLGVIEGLLAAGRRRDASILADATEAKLFDGKAGAFFDRLETGELSGGLDRIIYAGLNARARRVWLKLGRPGVAARIESYLWAHPQGLDAGDLAELAEARLGGRDAGMGAGGGAAGAAERGGERR